MSDRMPIEQLVAEWMTVEAAGGTPDALVERIVATTRRSRPLPRWLAVLRERPMHAQSRVVVGMPTRNLVVLVLLLLVLATVALVAGAAIILRPHPIAYEWPGLRGDAARTAQSARAPIGRPVVAWQFHADGAFRSSPAVAGDLVFASSDDGVLHAVTIDSGLERWSFRGTAPMNGPFVADGRVYAVDGKGIVHALDLADGSPSWQTTTPLRETTDVTVDDNRLFVGTADGLLVAIDASTGSELWRQAVSPARSPVHSPAATGGTVVAVTDDLVLRAFDAETGATRWQTNVGPGAVGTPVVADGLVFVGGLGDHGDPRLATYDLASGRQRWVAEDNIYSPAVADGIGYSGSQLGVVSAREIASGAERWRVSFGLPVRPPAVGGDVLYTALGGPDQLVALETATGGELWRLPLDGRDTCCIAIGRGMVFAGTSAGTLYAIGGDGASLSPRDGSAQTSPTVPSPSSSSPVAEPTPVPQLPPPMPAPTLAWASRSGVGEFAPFGLARAPDGRLWVAEGLLDRFSIFTPDGKFVESWGASGSGDGEFRLQRANGDPYGAVAFARDGSFFVLDAGNRQIDHFDRDRVFVSSWGGFGGGPGKFMDPVSIAIGSDDLVYVLDDLRGVIESFDHEGNVVDSIASTSPGVAPAVAANQLALGPDGHFYVSAIGPNQVVELDAAGKVVRVYGEPGSPGAFSEQPNVMAFDADGRLYVTQGPERGDAPGVLIFAVDGTYVGGFGSIASDADGMTFPWGLVVTDDAIYVADAGAVEVPAHGELRKYAPIQFP